MGTPPSIQAADDESALRELIADSFAVVDLAAEASEGRCPAEFLRFSRGVAKHFAARLSESQRHSLASHLHRDRGWRGIDPASPPPAADLFEELLFDRLRALGWLAR